MEPSNCKMPTPSPRLLPLHRNGPLTVTCPVSQRRGTGSAACTCPATFTICILLWLEQPQQKEGSRPQKSAFGKPTEQAQEAKAAVLCPGAPAHSLPRAPPAQLILSPSRVSYSGHFRGRCQDGTAVCDVAWVTQSTYGLHVLEHQLVNGFSPVIFSLVGQSLLTGYLFPHPLPAHTHPDSLRVHPQGPNRATLLNCMTRPVEWRDWMEQPRRG